MNRMSDTKLDVRVALRVFNGVRDHGTKRDGANVWQGMTVSCDFEGYTLFLNDGYCKLTIHFHNRYTFEGPSRIQRIQFLERLQRIDRLLKQLA